LYPFFVGYHDRIIEIFYKIDKQILCFRISLRKTCRLKEYIFYIAK